MFLFKTLLLAPLALAVPCSQRPSKTTGTAKPPTESGGPVGAGIKTPETVVLDGARLVCVKAAVQGKGNDAACTKKQDADYKGVMGNLLSQADYLLTQGPWTVTSKTMQVPNGTVNDYASQAPYWWPGNWEDASKPKCPYVQRDGVRNPEVDNYTDRRDLAQMMNATYTLSLSWWYTENAQYREHAAKALKTWFIEPATRMNPHLQHAQIIPCKNDGRAIGIIDFSQQYTDVLDAVAILDTVEDGVWGKKDSDAFKAWNTEFLTWLTESKFGKQELAAKNNHGTFAGMQIAAIASYLGQKNLAMRTLQDQLPRIDLYISPDGTQPLELKRETSWHYTNFVLVAYTRMAAIGEHLGVDVWGYVGSQGRSIQKAIEYTIPFATAQEKWPHKELHFQRFAAWDIVHFAADRGMQAAQAALPALEMPPSDLWALRPAPEQLDSILYG